ncbi:unnamed protein product [Urochloa humidicola]
MAESPPHRKPRLEAGVESEAPAPDLLSALPLVVLDKILSRLHIYDVVRTSVLSRAWRRRWETLPTVNLIGGPLIPAEEVDALLLRRTAPLRTFRLAGCRTWYVDALHDWLLYLSRNGVETLVLWFPPVGFRIHSSLFSCRELTSLSLTSCRLPPAPAGFAGFSSLKTLQFNKVTIPEHGGKQLVSLIAGSPSIESVKLMTVELIGDDPEAEDEWVIQAPNLRELTIASRFPYGGHVENLPRLQKAVLVGCNYAKFLMSMAHITELEFACGADWFAEVDVLDRLPFLFENLRSLVISVDFTEMFAILSFFCLLRSSPVLEELIVCGWSDGSQVVHADDDFLNAQWVDDMFAKLHVVRMENILCFSNEMHFVEFILSKARVLQLLSVSLGPDALCSNEEAMITIKQYPKASPDVQVIFLGSDSTNITSTKNAEVSEVQTTGGEHNSFNTPADAEVEQTQVEGAKHSSISTSTDNEEVEETQTPGSRCASINTSTENAKVDETQKTGNEHGLIHTSTENAEVEETQTAGSRLVNDVHPRRRQRLDLESVAQLEQLEADMRLLQENVRLLLDGRRLDLDSRTHVLNCLIVNLKYISWFKDLSERTNISLPPFPEPSSILSSLLVTSGTGDSPVNLGVNGAAIVHVDSSEVHGANVADNAHPDPREDGTINGASMA